MERGSASSAPSTNGRCAFKISRVWRRDGSSCCGSTSGGWALGRLTEVELRCGELAIPRTAANPPLIVTQARSTSPEIRARLVAARPLRTRSFASAKTACSTGSTAFILA